MSGIAFSSDITQAEEKIDPVYIIWYTDEEGKPVATEKEDPMYLGPAGQNRPHKVISAPS
jgi:hypothetical protein